MDTEPGQKDVAREFPGWHLWTGVAGLKYARTTKLSPPITASGRDWDEVRRDIRAKLVERDAKSARQAQP